jgi:hypothetical protein
MENYQRCVFQSLVDFMYKAELSLDQTNVQELLIAADMIQLKEASWTRPLCKNCSLVIATDMIQLKEAS